MLHTATLMAATTSFVSAMLSPSKCRVRVPAPAVCAANAAVDAVSSNWYRNDPYNWRALSSPVKAMISPEHPKKAASSTTSSAADFTALKQSRVPQANRLLYASVVASSRVARTDEEATAAPMVSRAQPPVTTPAPTSTTTNMAPAVRYAYVQFRHECCTYQAPFKISVGDQVIVEGDRGEDMGTVVDITAETPSYNVPCKVIRRATRKDFDATAMKEVKEGQALRLSQQLAESLGLNIRIVDTVFQMDLNKLTVYFSSKQHHIDFRKLQRTLFREYRCRIWLSNMAEIEAQKQLPRFR
jgi:hypothetical protein